MKVLVTGGAGYIGSHTAKALMAAGHEVVVFDNLSTGFQEAIPKKADFVYGDVRSTQELIDTISKYSVSAVVHFAAKLVVPESIEKPLDYYENNTGGMTALAKACHATSVRKLVFSSTAAVYGDATSTGIVDENSPIAPLNPYGHSKLMSEQILKDCQAAFGLEFAILRYFNVAGGALDGTNGQRTKGATHLIKVACEAATGKRESVGVFGSNYPTPDGTGVRDYIHVEDLADIHVRALENLNHGGASDTFNCGYGNGSSVLEVLSMVEAVSGQKLNIRMLPRRPGDAAQIVAESSKVRRVLSWTPKHQSLETICKTSFNWEQSFCRKD